METIKNTKRKVLTIMCNNHLKLSVCKIKNNQVFGYGSIFNLLKNFAKYINATVEIFSIYNIMSFDISTKLFFYSKSMFLNHYAMTS